MAVLKKDLRFSFTEWFKYNRAENIIRSMQGYINDERIITHNTLCLMKNDIKKIIHFRK
jgi:hypothetical protein